MVVGEWGVVLVLVNGLKMILVFKLNKQYVIGLTQKRFDTNDEGGRDGRTDRVKYRDAIASKNNSGP